MKKEELWQRSLVGVCALILLLGGGGLILRRPQDFSETENRALRGWGSLSAAELTDGRFGASLSKVCADQFPFRRELILWKAQTERWLGKGEHHGILWGRDGYLIPRDESADHSVLLANLEAIASLTRTEPNLRLWILPRSIDVMEAWLPKGYGNGNGEALESYLSPLTDSYEKVTDALRLRARTGEQVWYRTDHHYTTTGAYECYRVLAPTLGLAPLSEELFFRQTVSQSFLGSSHSALGGVAEQADSVILYRYEGDEDFLVENAETGVTRRGFYQRDRLLQKDQYQIFLGGNTAFLRIRSASVGDRPRYLVIKDSFANAMVPFLAIHADLDLLDPRYATLPLSVYLEKEEYDGILLVVGLGTLATDPSFEKIGR